MSSPLLITIELAFVILLSWAVAVALLRGLHRDRDAARTLVARRTQQWKDSKAALRDARLTIAHLQQKLDEASQSDTDTQALLAEFDQDLAADASTISELDALHAQLDETVGRFESSWAESPTTLPELMTKELTLLRERNERSGKVIATLSKALERNRQRVRALEQSVARGRSDYGSASAELEAGYRRLAHENKSLHVRIQKAASTHQASLQAIGEKLRRSEEKYRAHVQQADERQQSLQNVIDQLRQQLRAADGQQMDAARIEELLAQVNEMDEALERALRERDFLDQRYTELEQVLAESENAVQELERTKVEYRMLEQRYLEMEERIDHSVALERRRNQSPVNAAPYREKGIEAPNADDLADLIN